MRNLLDVVYDGEELPMRVDFGPAAQSEAAHSLVLQVSKHGFDGALRQL